MWSALTSSQKQDAINQGILIQEDGILTIDQNINFQTTSSITVYNSSNSFHNGGVLIVQAGVVLGAINTTWNGILVVGNSSAGHYLTGGIPDPTIYNSPLAYRGVINPIHGRVELQGCEIKDAGTAITSDEGGIIESYVLGNKITNCQIGIHINNYSNTASMQAGMNACNLFAIRFENNTYLSSSYEFRDYKMVYLTDVDGVRIGGCEFLNTSTFNLCIAKRGLGIDAERSSFALTEGGIVYNFDPATFCPGFAGDPLNPMRNQFKNLTGGIYIDNLTSGGGYSGNEAIIRYADFENFAFGVSINGGGGHVITNCEFTFDPPSFTTNWQIVKPVCVWEFPEDAYLKAIHSTGIRNLLCYNNTSLFTNGGGTGFGNSNGKYFNHIYLENIGNPASPISMVKNNTFTTIVSGNYLIDEIGINMNGQLSRTYWECNTFSGNGIDVKINDGCVVPAVHPFGNITTTANVYDVNATYNIYKHNIPSIQYHHSGSLSIQNVNIQPPSGEPNCQITCPEIEQYLAIKETSTSLISLTPNPTNGSFKIKSNPQFIPESMIIIDQLGQTVVLSERINQAEPIDVSHLPSGIYYVRLFNQETSLVQKIFLLK